MVSCGRDGATRGVPSRDELFSILGSRTFDILVIGGGINGAGIARDAALRGLHVALVERGDFAGGTSSRSSRLIHGGLRYLAQRDFSLVRAACRERDRLRRLAPHLVRPLAFLLPVYRGGPLGVLQLAAGLWLYDLLAAFRNLHRHRLLGPAGVAIAEPALGRQGLRLGARYYDCWTDDARLTIETVLDAREAGAVVVSRAEVKAFVRAGSRVAGAVVKDVLGGQEVEVCARVVVNATGPWLDRVRSLADPGARPVLRLTKGVHLVVPRERVGNRGAVVLFAPCDGRLLFVLPWGDYTLIGTTDTDYDGLPDEVAVEPSDVAYLLGAVNHHFPAAELRPADVVSAYAGLRPLVAPPAGARLAPSAVSREESIFEHPPGLISIAGGKLTTFRRVAAAVVDRAARELSRSGRPGSVGSSRTAKRPLPGAWPGSLADLEAELVVSMNGHSVPPPVLRQLVERYGARAGHVLGVLNREQGLEEPILAGLGFLKAEVVAAVEEELALSVEDVLRRRTTIALMDREQGASAAREVASLMGERLGWDAARVEREAAEYVARVAAERRRWGGR